MTVHCENYDAIAWRSAALLAAGRRAPKYHAWSRPAVVEREATHRAIALAERVDKPIGVFHITDIAGLRMVADGDLASAPKLHVLHIPGGPGQAALVDDDVVLDWMRTQAAGALCVFSVCTGVLICGAAGLLRGKRATTHWTAMHLLHYFGDCCRSALRGGR